MKGRVTTPCRRRVLSETTWASAPPPSLRPAARATSYGAKADPSATVKAAQRLNRAAGVIALSVLADSAAEHYRGQFHNRAMVTPLVLGALSLLASAHGHGDRRPGLHQPRNAIYASAALAGLAGLGFHVFNVGKKPGGFDWQNLFYSAPLVAPLALVSSGALGILSERVRDTKAGGRPTIGGLPAGRVVGAATSLGLLGTAAEAALLHLRGAFHDPFMWLPVSVSPLAAILIGNAAAGRTTRRPFTSFFMRLTAALGLAGAGFHAYGVSRNMGGWRNWSQNLLNGPPIPAPPSFTGLALAGLAALGLMRDHPDD